MNSVDHGQQVEHRERPAEKVILSKIMRRIIPFLMLCYFVSYLDRINVGMAAITMNKSLGLTPIMYGAGAGIYFIGYFLFEVPSNLMMQKVGARVWIARIMITWGLVSGATAFVVGPHSFFIVRFLLGVAEAGFFPGLVLYLSWWFPAAYRARMTGMFMAAMPIAGIIGAPISGLLLGLNGILGLHGWQWLFITEALPAIILGFVVYRYLTDRPADAAWLAPAEREWLTTQMEAEWRASEKKNFMSIAKAFLTPQVLALSFVCFGANIANYGLTLWLPQIVKGFGLSNVETGFVSAIPSIFASLSMILWTRSSDRTGERIGHISVAAICGAGGLAICAILHNPVATMVALCLASVGIYALIATFWGWAPTLLAGPGAAAGMAIINSLGALSGYAGPFIFGWVKTATGDYRLGLLALAMGPVLSAFVTVVFLRNAGRRRESLSYES
jgi:ACS family tartrate transporter-like MFS transporter